MVDLIHGGDTEGYREAYGAEPLDFSANISPLGLPCGVREALVRALPDAERYPDPLCRRLRAAIAQSEGLEAENVYCGNGAADVIDRLVLALRPKQALILAPTFAEYGQTLRRAGCVVTEYRLKEENGFRLTEGILPHIRTGMDLLFLCEPNNPTGCTTAPALLARIAERCRETGTLLVADECFNDFLDEPQRHTLRPLLHRAPIYILRAFTKMYAMAGIRLGYGLCADAALQERLRHAGQPWNVSGLAQAAGLAALQEKEYVRRVREITQAERAYLCGELAKLGILVFPPEANYILFKASDAHLEQKLKEKGIMIRSCANYSGLNEHFYRIAVKAHEDNERLIQAIKEVQTWQNH